MSNISFNQIPVNLLTPGHYVEFDNSKAINGLVVMPNRILILAQKTGDGDAHANIPFIATNVGDVRARCGNGSHAALMFAAAFAVTDTVETTILPLEDASAGSAATGKITITGTPVEPGLINLYIGGERVQSGVSLTDDASNIAASLSAAINANTDLPVTAVAAEGTLTITARNKGSLGNDIDLRLNYYAQSDRTPANMHIAITPMSGGAGDPSIASALANLGEAQYNTILIGLSDPATLQLLEAELDARWGPLKQTDGRAHTAVRGTVGSLNSWGSNRNSPHLLCWSIDRGSPSPAWKHAAVWGAICAYHLGGIDPARPVQTLVGVGLLPGPHASRFIRAERNNLLSYGLATYVADNGGNLTVERAVTTYTHNAGGFIDPSYRDAETMYTLSYLRYSVRARIAQKFPRSKLANDGANIEPGQATVTPRIIRGELIALFRDWEGAGLVENFDQFKKDLIVARNATDVNRVDVLLPPDLMNQFRVFAAKLEFRL